MEGCPPVSLENRTDRNEFSLYFSATSRANPSLSSMHPLLATTVRRHSDPSHVLLTTSGIPDRSHSHYSAFSEQASQNTVRTAAAHKTVNIFIFILLRFVIFAPFCLTFTTDYTFAVI